MQNIPSSLNRRRFLKRGVSCTISISLLDIIPSLSNAENKEPSHNCGAQGTTYEGPDALCKKAGDDDHACDQRLGDDKDQGCTAKGQYVTTNSDGNCNNGTDPARKFDPDESCQPNSQRVASGSSGNADQSCSDGSNPEGIWSPDHHCGETLNLQNGATDPDDDGEAPYGPIPQCVNGFGEDPDNG